MSSGSENRSSLAAAVFPLVALTSILLLLLPYAIILFSENPGIIGIPLRGSHIVEDYDVYDHAWHFWWVSRALESGQDPRYCKLIYSPDGISMVFTHIGWYDTIFFAIMGTGSNDPVLSHNLSLLLGTILTALFGWLLARSWGADRYGALFTALAIAWLPVRTAHLLQHYQLANCWTLPAALWLCREYLKKGRFRTLTAYTVIVTLAAIQSPFFAVFAFLGLYATCFIIDGSWKKTGILTAGWAIATAVTGVLIFTASSESVSVSTHWSEAIYWAAEPQSFILPSPFGTAGHIFNIPVRFSWMSNTQDGVVTTGLIVLAAFTIFIWKRKNWKFPAVFLALSLLALGPELRIFGRPLGILLPFRFIQLFPLGDGIRSPSRFAMLGGLFAALGAGMGVTLLKGKWKLLFFTLLLFELFVPVLDTLSTGIPSACRNIPDDRIVLELPVDNHIRMYAWFQTAASYSRRYAFLARLPELNEEDVLLQEAGEEGDVLVYHRWLYDKEDRNRYDTLYAELFPEGSNTDSVWVLMNGGVQ